MNTIRTKLLVGFGSVILVFLISAVVSLYFIRVAKLDTEVLQNKLFPANNVLIDLQSEIGELQLYLQSYVFIKDTSMKVKIDSKKSELERIYRKASTTFEGINDTVIHAKWNELSPVIQKYLMVVDTISSSTDQPGVNGIDKAAEIYKQNLMPVLVDLDKSFNTELAKNEEIGIANLLNDKIGEVSTDIDHQMNFIFLAIIIFIATSFLLSMIIANIASRSILRPILYAVQIAEDISNGKRDMTIINKSSDETGLLLKALSHMLESIKDSERKINDFAIDNKRLYDSVVKAANLFSKHATNVASGELSGRLDLEREGISQEIMMRLGKDLNSMTDNLSNVTNDIMMACSSMVTTLEEVRHAVDAQSSGASEQASSINEITASISEIEKSASQTMNKAKDLGSVAEKTRQSGQLGLESIEASVMGMKVVRDRVQVIAQTILDLSRQTQQVGEITSVVNNLAQQSKMLALNASIEAAKAGDAGKGFAVVASEVKNLAEQSEQSTSQVQKILEDIRIATEKAVMVTEEGTKGVDNGLTMIEKTGVVIRDLNDVIRDASMVSQQIEAAVRQETAGIEQITAGMNEINTVTTSFVDSVSQTTEAMDNLANLSSKLKSRVETYKL